MLEGREDGKHEEEEKRKKNEVERKKKKKQVERKKKEEEKEAVRGEEEATQISLSDRPSSLLFLPGCVRGKDSFEDSSHVFGALLSEVLLPLLLFLLRRLRFLCPSLAPGVPLGLFWFLFLVVVCAIFLLGQFCVVVVVRCLFFLRQFPLKIERSQSLRPPQNPSGSIH